MRISTILIGLAFISFIFIGFIMVYTDGVSHYTTTGTVNSTQFNHITQSLDSLHQNSIQTQNSMNAISGLGGPFNILGGFIVGAYGSIKQAMLSFGLMNDIAQDSASVLPLGNLQGDFLILIGTILVIIGFILLAKFLSNSEAL